MSIMRIRSFFICLIIISGIVIVIVIIIGVVIRIIRVHIGNGMIAPIIVVMAAIIIVVRIIPTIIIPVGIKIRAPKSEVP